jgi:hypothetical protein
LSNYSTIKCLLYIFSLQIYYNLANGKKQAANKVKKRRNETMKIAIICANGRAGKLIVQEAIARGADVTAIVRGENQSACM